MDKYISGTAHDLTFQADADLGDNDHLNAGGVAGGEVDGLQALLGDGHAGHAHVVLAGLDAADDGAELGVHNGQLAAHLVGNGGGHLRVDTHHRVVLRPPAGRRRPS